MKKSWYVLMDGNRKVGGGTFAYMSLIQLYDQNKYHRKRTGYKWEVADIHEVVIGTHCLGRVA